jgi:hypothetical protein
MAIFTTPDSLPLSSAREIVRRVQDILWLDCDGNYDPDKKQALDSLSRVVEVMAEYGLIPYEIETG